MQAFGAFSPNKMNFLAKKHPHLPKYSAKRERTFEVGRFYTVSVPSKLLIFLRDMQMFLNKNVPRAQNFFCPNVPRAQNLFLQNVP